MTHLDDETLALLALGEERASSEQEQHLATCDRCAAELDSLTRLVDVGRSSRDVEIVQPRPEVWQRIHAELGLSAAVAEVPVADGPADVAPLAVEPAPVDAPARGGHPHAAPHRRRPRRPGRAVIWAVAAAALVIGLVGGVIGTALVSSTPTPRLVAVAKLDPFPTWQASGSARVEETLSGSRSVVVDLQAPSGGLREVWLIDPDTSGLVSLGLLSGDSGQFSIPSGVDLRRYTLVDVSDEPDDGNPAHSGDSIVRGRLRAA